MEKAEAHEAKNKSATVDTSATVDASADIKKLVDFCNKYNSIEENKRRNRVVHETDCVLTKYSYLDVNCHCFRHKSYVVHRKWFCE
jgi:hypothetical protein